MTMQIEFATPPPPATSSPSSDIEADSKKKKVQKNFWLLKENHDYLLSTAKRLGVTQTGLINILISRMRDREDNNQPILTIREDQDIPPGKKKRNRKKPETQ
jgi:hypothetical protein